jgi:hypothetical protein
VRRVKPAIGAGFIRGDRARRGGLANRLSCPPGSRRSSPNSFEATPEANDWLHEIKFEATA